LNEPLSSRGLTYDTVGLTVSEGWSKARAADRRTYEQSLQLGDGPDRWAFASAEVMSWGVKRRSGFTIDAETVSDGDRLWLVAHLGPLSIREPVQVVGVVNTADRRGFAYGTLSGHPVSGEEAFLVEQRADGTVWLTLRSLTLPGKGLWRMAFPLALLAQHRYRRRYLRALAGAIGD
jgi:uncharacterized protein (UPF0548 family)